MYRFKFLVYVRHDSFSCHTWKLSKSIPQACDFYFPFGIFQIITSANEHVGKLITKFQNSFEFNGERLKFAFAKR